MNASGPRDADGVGEPTAGAVDAGAIAKSGAATDIPIRVQAARLAAVDTTQGRARDECVRVTTIHRVKGLEWDYVFIPECDEGWMPLPGDEESGCFAKRDAHATLERSPAVESERRLFYVAITRARTACFVSCGDEESRSRFLRDALQPATAKPRR